uniref:Uncharacterized protein n=1 Tax=Arundo donax TaxID=35708 RepID=A0A0A9GY52_ARUDO
MNLASSSVYT